MKDNDFAQFLETLKTKCDIVTTISRYVPLQKKGRNYWACCPFHREKTPSFTVNPDGFFKCFGCGQSGDVIRFVEAYENTDFSDAVKLLAKSVGLEVPVFKGEKSDLPEKKKKKELYHEICTETARFYHTALYADSVAAQKALEYLDKRGIEGATIKKFGIGFSPDYGSLPARLQKKFAVEDCLAAGVISRSEKGTYYDALFERLIFPIINVYGQVSGFGGRILKKSDFAKYKNTAQTLIFDKSKNLYSINNVKKVKQTSRKAIDYIIMVEGYMDAVSLIQAGFDYTVASMGTSLTVEQAKLIHRFTDTVVISYDGDAAGQAATLRGLEILKAEGLNVRIALLPDGLDPDDIIKKRGKDAYQKCLESAMPFIEYRLKIIRDKYILSGERAEEAKRNYASDALSVIKTLSGTEKESFIKQLSRETGFAPDFLKKEAEKPETKDIEFTAKSDIIIDTRNVAAVRFILAAMVFNKPYAHNFDLSAYITEAGHADVYAYVKEKREKGDVPVPAMLYEKTEKSCADEILNTVFGNDEEGEKYYEDCVKTLVAEQEKNRLAELKRLFNAETDIEKKKEIAKQIQTEQKRRRNT